MTVEVAGVRPGARRGLDACASARGTFGVLALDDRQNLRRELRPDDPASVTYDEMGDFKRAVVRALAPVATGTPLDPEIGAARPPGADDDRIESALLDNPLDRRRGVVVPRSRRRRDRIAAHGARPDLADRGRGPRPDRVLRRRETGAG